MFEDPSPGITKGEPPTERWTDGWCHHGCDSIQRERQTALLRRKRVGENGGEL